MYVPTTQIHDGDNCPTCHQLVKLYPRTLGDRSARLMIAMYRTDPFEYMYVPALYRKIEVGGGDTVKCAHWKLIEQQPGERPDGSKRNGYWRLTKSGRQFVQGRLWVRQKALIYNNTCFGFKGKLWHITDALGHKFNYWELMHPED